MTTIKKKDIRDILELIKSWEVLSREREEALHSSLKTIDEGTVTKSYHESLKKKYRMAKQKKERRTVKRWMIIGLTGIIVPLAIGIPGLYFEYERRVKHNALVRSALNDVQELLNKEHFSAARDRLQPVLESEPDSELLAFTSLNIDLSEAIVQGVVSEELLTRAELALNLNSKSAILCDRLGSLYNLKGRLYEAIEMKRQARSLAEEIGSEELLARTTLGLGSLYIEDENYDKAREHISAASSYFCSLDRIECADSLYALARLAFNKESYSNCFDHLNDAREQENIQYRTRAAIYLLMGECGLFQEESRMAASERFVEDSVKIYSLIRDHRGQAYAVAVLSQVQSRLGKCQSAKHSVRKALDLGSSANPDMLTAQVLGNVVTAQVLGMSSEVLERCQDVEGAYLYAKVALESIRPSGVSRMIEFARGEVTRLRDMLDENFVQEIDRKAELRCIELGIERE